MACQSVAGEKVRTLTGVAPEAGLIWNSQSDGIAANHSRIGVRTGHTVRTTAGRLDKVRGDERNVAGLKEPFWQRSLRFYPTFGFSRKSFL
jgi:hypothetical protein